jgi:hypothetical protein
MRDTLEQHRVFPYLAWTAIFSLSAATLYLVFTLRHDMLQLQAQRTDIEHTLTGELRNDPVEY